MASSHGKPSNSTKAKSGELKQKGPVVERQLSVGGFGDGGDRRRQARRKRSNERAAHPHHVPASGRRTSCSSWATTSAGSTSAPTTGA